MNSRIKSFGISAISGFLLFAGWPPINWDGVLLIAFVPLLYNSYTAPNTKQAVLRFAQGFFIFLLLLHFDFLVRGNWTHRIWILSGLLVIPILWSIPIAIGFLIKKRYGGYAILLFPFLYILQEQVHYYWDFPITWFHLGYGLAPTSWLIGGYPHYGPTGGSFLTILINTVICYGIIDYQTKKKWRLASTVFILSLLVLIGPYFLFFKGEQEWPIRVAIFQPSLSEIEIRNENLDAQIDFLEDELEAQSQPNVDLIVCPEAYFCEVINNPIFVNSIEKHPAINRLIQLSMKYNAPILSGAILVKLYRANNFPTPSSKRKEEGIYYDIINGSIFIEPTGRVSWQSKKALVPLAEAIPFRALFDGLQSVGLMEKRMVDQYGIVDSKMKYEYQNINIAAPVCYESLFPNILDKYVSTNENLMVILSTYWTDSEISRAGHAEFSIPDAVMYKLPVLFCTTNSESRAFNKRGKEIDVAPHRLAIVEIRLQ
ncbi:MAG: hypothetical protein KDC83_06905 [Flavobacteriales bacterium]|nr:hypothetical protein [Flavobacteriales bacterium]